MAKKPSLDSFLDNEGLGFMITVLSPRVIAHRFVFEVLSECVGGPLTPKGIQYRLERSLVYRWLCAKAIRQYPNVLKSIIQQDIVGSIISCCVDKGWLECMDHEKPFGPYIVTTVGCLVHRAQRNLLLANRALLLSQRFKVAYPVVCEDAF